MDSEKKSAKSKIWLGLLILTPFVIVFWFLNGIVRGFSEIIHWLWINFIPFKFTLPTLAEGLLGLFLFILIAYGVAALYYSKKTRLSLLVDNLLSRIPFIKEFWQYGAKEKSLDLSKLKAAIIKSSEGIWELVYLVGREEIEKGGVKFATLTKVLQPTYPLPFTGFFRMIDEEELKKAGKIIYLQTSSDFARIYLSFGFLGPKKFKADF